MNNHTENGAVEGLPQATELILSNGIKLWAYPISRLDNAALVQQWRDANPEPDKKAYELPLDPEMASYEGQTLPAEENPAWHALLQERRQSLNDTIVRGYLLGYTDFNFPPEQTEEKLIERYQRMITQKRKVLELPEDAWEATLLYGVIQTLQEKQQIIHAVEATLPVELGEVIDQVAIFRPVDQRQPAGKVPHRRTKAQSPAVETGTQPDYQQPGV